MLRIKTTGPWTRAKSILKTYKERVRFVRIRIAEDVANAFVDELSKRMPNGPESYKKSLRVVRVTGVHGIVAFAIVSSGMEERVCDIASGGLCKRTVVYIQPSSMDPVVELLGMANPWPVGMLPGGIPKGKAVFVHRTVTTGEYDWAEKQVLEFIKTKQAELKAHGVTIGKSPDDTKSFPDLVSLALRSEFGINSDAKPHWRPTIEWLKKNILAIVNKDEKIEKSLSDPLFREHKMGIGSSLSTTSIDDFNRSYAAFQRKVMMNG